MSEKQYQAIVDAIDRLARGEARKSNGKLIPINVAREAGISKASLYRYFGNHELLRKEFDDCQKQGVRIQDRELTAADDALAAAQTEVLELRKRLDEVKSTLKLRDQQLFLLWAENKRLARDLKRSVGLTDNVRPFSGPHKSDK